ncbi:conjugative transfer signal peptidase TraF [Hahella ganghwensis]|uniref:conjugative transfer signal peptidase TraF n=1 Tax=Hahella ganghwensis TaxID=286420 RepID=UPI000364F13D|nr:conjugative transfer signal peptidase TraF [Hahella ganghwensis]
MMYFALKRLYSIVALVGIFLMLLAAGCYAAGVRINTTKSIPLGIYWVSKEPIHKGAYVLFCPPDTSAFSTARDRGYIGAGYCPGGYGYMMKRILAAKGDSVSITPEGVTVNGELLKLSKVLQSDKAKRPLPHFYITDYRLEDSELLLMSDVSAISFDGRYFGPIERSQVETVIKPVFIW